MRRSKIFRDRKGSSDVTILGGGRTLLSVAVIVVIMLPFFGKRLFGFGSAGANAYSIDKGFADLITKAQALEDNGEAVPHPFTVDKDFYLVGFNYAENANGKATKPPDCNGIACFCVCTEPTCQKLDVKNNKGMDCRPLPDYTVIAAQKGIRGNEEGWPQPNKYVRVDGSVEDVNYFYVKGEKTIIVNLKREKLKNGVGLYIGKID